jgi:protein-tyrosine-phosphatase/DNA-binding transcriptional ArsR family regulator
MSSVSPSALLPEFLKALAHELRWNILVALSRSDQRVTELCHMVGQPQNVVSYHLRKLREQQVVSERRSSADSRDFYYSLELESFRSRYLATGEAVLPALCSDFFLREPSTLTLPTPPVRVLFLCTHNSARSQMAEGMVRYLSNGKIEVMSAGSQPSRLHPFGVRAMNALGIDITQQRAKSVETLQDQSFEYIVTVCDRMREICPAFPEGSELLHWSIADPVEVEGTETERLRAFEHTAQQLLTRTRYLLARIEQEHAAKEESTREEPQQGGQDTGNE